MPKQSNETIRDLLAMPVGASRSVVNGYVIRKGRALFVLRTDNLAVRRARWGTAKEISDDAAYLATTGHLPQPIGQPW